MPSTGKRPKILWVGDGYNKTGFEFVTRGFLTRLQMHGWEVVQLGIGYNGEPDHGYPWRIWPAVGPMGGDYLGISTLPSVIAKEKPDLVFILGDSWVVPKYFAGVPEGIPIVVFPPVDAPNQPCAVLFNGSKTFGRGCDLAICPTSFGVNELKKGGYTGPTAVVGYGLDVERYGGLEPRGARGVLGMPPALVDGFIVGNVNRNAPRKRIDLTMRAFAGWLEAYPHDNAYLLLHMAEDDRFGWNLRDLARFYGLKGRIIFTQGQHTDDYASFEKLRLVYCALDVLISTTVGEGWGLTTAEAMASSVPCAVPDYSALGEWADGGVQFYGIRDVAVAHGTNTVWAVPDHLALIDHLENLYQNPMQRYLLGARGCKHISAPRFSWAAVGTVMDTVLREVLDARSQGTASPDSEAA